MRGFVLAVNGVLDDSRQVRPHSHWIAGPDFPARVTIAQLDVHEPIRGLLPVCACFVTLSTSSARGRGTSRPVPERAPIGTSRFSAARECPPFIFQPHVSPACCGRCTAAARCCASPSARASGSSSALRSPSCSRCCSGSTGGQAPGSSPVQCRWERSPVWPGESPVGRRRSPPPSVPMPRPATHQSCST